MEAKSRSSAQRAVLSVGVLESRSSARSWLISPSLPSVQEAVRENPVLETLVLLGSISAAGLILVGGAIGDSRPARPIILGGLTAELIACIVGLLVPSGPLFVLSRVIGHSGAVFVIPVSIALVATSYRGAVRATAIGLAYGAYGAAGAASPILLQIVPILGALVVIFVVVPLSAALWLLLMFKAYKGEEFKLPLVGQMASDRT